MKKGIISDAHVSGDFFGTAQADSLGEVLRGCRFDSEDLRQALLSHGMEEAIYGITIEDIVRTLAG